MNNNTRARLKSSNVHMSFVSLAAGVLDVPAPKAGDILEIGCGNRKHTVSNGENMVPGNLHMLMECKRTFLMDCVAWGLSDHASLFWSMQCLPLGRDLGDLMWCEPRKLPENCPPATFIPRACQEYGTGVLSPVGVISFIYRRPVLLFLPVLPFTRCWRHFTARSARLFQGPFWVVVRQKGFSATTPGSLIWLAVSLDLLPHIPRHI